MTDDFDNLQKYEQELAGISKSKKGQSYLNYLSLPRVAGKEVQTKEKHTLTNPSILELYIWMRVKHSEIEIRKFIM
jgi:hypothetical protein